MNKKDLETFAREATKSIKTEKNLKPFSLMRLPYRAKIECPNAKFNWKWNQSRCAAGNRILKNHDFDLMLHQTLKDRLIVQYRHLFYSIRSWHEPERDKGKQVNPWPEFIREKLDYWESFVNKWILGHGSETNVLLVLYESRVEREPLIRIAEFSGFDNCDVN